MAVRTQYNSFFARHHARPVRILEGISRVLSRPLAEAQSLKDYGTTGYIILVVPLLIGIALFWLAGWSDIPISDAPQPIQSLYAWASKKIPFLPDLGDTVLGIPPIIWIALYSYPKIRRWIGENFANFLLKLLYWSLEAGEWCLEHRWRSLGLIISLAALTTAGGYHEYELANQRQALTSDFEHWLHEAEEFVQHSSMAKSEADRYRPLARDWHEGFGDMPKHVGTAAVCLNQMMSELYLQYEPQKPWSDHLSLKLNDLETLLSNCPEPKPQQASRKAFSLMNILMGRVYVRRFDVTQDKDVQFLVGAYQKFSAAELPESLQTEELHAYRSAINNGKGTVFAGLVSAKLPADWTEKNRSICYDRSDCIVKALNAYDLAAKGYDACSFEDKRRINNEIDLLLRVGYKYEQIAQEAPGLHQQWTDAGQLASELETRASSLMKCNASGPFISTTFVTIAQALAIAAQLRGGDGDIATVDARSAALYLLWAYSFEPQNAKDWHLYYFCGVSKGLSPIFKAPLATPPATLPPTEHLIGMINSECQNNH
jgi:hypothetical protein